MHRHRRVRPAALQDIRAVDRRATTVQRDNTFWSDQTEAMSDNIDVHILERVDECDREVGTGVLVHPHLVAVRPPLDEIIRNLADPSVPTFGVRFPGPGEAVQEVASVLM